MDPLILAKINCSTLGISCNFALEPSKEVVEISRVKSGCKDSCNCGEGSLIAEREGNSKVIVPEKCSKVRPKEMGRMANRGRGKLTRRQVEIAK